MSAHTSTAALAADEVASEQEPEARKRREIIDGARRVFFEKGFEGASMDEIARAAQVSKATIYVYFQSKADLFEALVKMERGQSAERLFEFDADDPDVERQLTRIGTTFVTMMVRPNHIRLVRMVIGVAEKFPAVGRAFFEAGPAKGCQELAALLERQTALGKLQVDDSEAAAFEFFNLCQSKTVKGLLFGLNEAPDAAEIEAMVARAVRMFLAVYGRSA